MVRETAKRDFPHSSIALTQSIHLRTNSLRHSANMFHTLPSSFLLRPEATSWLLSSASMRSWPLSTRFGEPTPTTRRPVSMHSTHTRPGRGKTVSVPPQSTLSRLSYLHACAFLLTLCDPSTGLPSLLSSTFSIVLRWSHQLLLIYSNTIARDASNAHRDRRLRISSVSTRRLDTGNLRPKRQGYRTGCESRRASRERPNYVVRPIFPV